MQRMPAGTWTTRRHAPRSGVPSMSMRKLAIRHRRRAMSKENCRSAFRRQFSTRARLLPCDTMPNCGGETGGDWGGVSVNAPPPARSPRRAVPGNTTANTPPHSAFWCGKYGLVCLGTRPGGMSRATRRHTPRSGVASMTCPAAAWHRWLGHPKTQKAPDGAFCSGN